MNQIYTNLHHLKIGDILIRAKGPLSTHYMVYAGIQNGNYIVAENQNGFGVRYTTLPIALAGNTIKRFEKFGGSESERNLVIPRINQMIGKNYDLIMFNCEHFARLISTGKIESAQVRTGSGIAIIGGATLLAAKNDVINFIGFASIVAGMIGLLSQKNQ